MKDIRKLDSVMYLYFVHISSGFVHIFLMHMDMDQTLQFHWKS